MQELQLVQEDRGTWHVCAAYVDGVLRKAWDQHPDEEPALSELRALAAGRRVLPLVFVPRKYEDWRWGRQFNGDEEARTTEARAALATGLWDKDLDVWPVRLADLASVVVPRHWDFVVPVDEMASDR